MYVAVRVWRRLCLVIFVVRHSSVQPSSMSISALLLAFFFLRFVVRAATGHWTVEASADTSRRMRLPTGSSLVNSPLSCRCLIVYTSHSHRCRGRAVRCTCDTVQVCVVRVV